jgi:hypothetical protein
LTKGDLGELYGRRCVGRLQASQKQGDGCRKEISGMILGEGSFTLTAPIGEDLWKDSDVFIKDNIDAWVMFHSQSSWMF